MINEQNNNVITNDKVGARSVYVGFFLLSSFTHIKEQDETLVCY
jgi:hypothetical protein